MFSKEEDLKKASGARKGSRDLQRAVQCSKFTSKTTWESDKRITRTANGLRDAICLAVEMGRHWRVYSTARLKLLLFAYHLLTH